MTRLVKRADYITAVSLLYSSSHHKHRLSAVRLWVKILERTYKDDVAAKPSSSMATSSPNEFACSLAVGGKERSFDDEPADWIRTYSRKSWFKKAFTRRTASAACSDSASHAYRT